MLIFSQKQLLTLLIFPTVCFLIHWSLLLFITNFVLAKVKFCSFTPCFLTWKLRSLTLKLHFLNNTSIERHTFSHRSVLAASHIWYCYRFIIIQFRIFSYSPCDFFDDMGGSAAENTKMLNKEGSVKVLISSTFSPEAKGRSSNTDPVIVQNADVLFLLGFMH